MTDFRARAGRNGIGDGLRRAVARNPKKDALIFRDRTWSYEEMETAAFRIATHLRDAGLKKGDRVAAFARNSDAYYLLWLACAQSGLIHVPANYGLTGPELRYIVEQSGSRALVYDRALKGSIDDMGPVEGLEFLSAFDGGDAIDVMAAATGAFDPEREWDVSEDDYVQILYTSGTTGKPKGGLMKHRALMSEFHSCIHALEYVESDRCLWSLPLYHSGQIHTFSNPQIMVGSTCALLEQPKPEDIFACIERNKITSFFAPPTVWVGLLRHPGFDSHDLSSLNKVYYGASIMPEPILVELRKRLNGARVFNCYGQSETGPLATVLKPEEHDGRLTSCGRPVLNVETRVVDEDDNDVPVGETGEIVHRTPHVITEYWNRPDATDEAFKNGWFHTGDMGRFDAEGFLYVVDRVKDVINTGGVLVASREVEDVLFSHEAVFEVAVVGLPDEKWLEAIAAMVVLKEGHSPTEADLIAHAKKSLAHYKIPKRIVFVEDLPRNASGKILKRELRRVHGGEETAVHSGAAASAG
ncbi:fatty acyl-CoA synthetase [uncultured Albimonas sp.]|uniref:fatty acyl-CoA synthetase n=1 Tax=uncultured Albimonas sp. TaxID=1331701 RepID=UPI0030EE3A10|tara:strand:- start:2483 stop:4063 length:1581 start_codon:yes stop_codon:yes gene_type:complete